MPEEINRVAADHICDRLLAPTQTAIENLTRESLADRAVLTGDVMQDAVRFYAAKAEQQSTIRQKLAIESCGYLVATIHRAENTSPRVLGRLLAALNSAARTWLPVVFPIHPRTAAVIRSSLPDWRPDPGVMQIEPLGYLDMLALTANCRCVLTDSGGLQKEAAFVGRPCITLRDETEWTETVTGGANLLAGSDGRMLDECIGRWREVGEDTIARQIATTAAKFGDGCAARLIVDEAVALAHASTA
jgi:UDP-N-acetylglucosamine 2-epimerase